MNANKPAHSLQSSFAELTGRSNLTASQLMLWLGQQLHPQVPLYNNVLAFEIQGAVEPKHFRHAFQALIDRHDAFRIIFRAVDGIPQQQLLPHLQYDLPVLDFSAEADPEGAYRAWARDRGQQPFDLEACTFDAALVKLARDRVIWHLNQHHLSTDPHSRQLAFAATSEYYARSIAGTLADADPVPTFFDYVAYERQQRTATSVGRAANYWQEKLAQAPEPIQLYNNTFEPGLAPEVETLRAQLGPERSRCFRERASQGALLPSADLAQLNYFAAVLFAYLYRVSGNTKLAIALPFHNRPTRVLKQTTGLLMELFPLHLELEPDETFTSLLAKVSRESGNLLRFAKPGASRFALDGATNVVLNYNNVAFGEFNGWPVRTEWHYPEAVDSNHPFRLQVHDLNGTGDLTLNFDLNCALIPAHQRQWVATHFLNLFDACLADPDRPLATIDLVRGEELQVLTALGQDSQYEARMATSVVGQLEAQAAKMPNTVAVVCSNQTLTYGELNQQVNRWARYLRQQGVSAEVPVGLFLPRSLDLVVAVWAILKAGGAYVPIEPDYPSERIATILKDTRAPLVMTSAELATKLPLEGNSRALPMATLAPIVAGESSQNPDLPAAGDRLAYVLYTSGSTGTPKGVMVEHSSLANYVAWARHEYLQERYDRAPLSFSFPLFSPLSFDLTVTSLFVPLTAGGTVRIYPNASEGLDLAIQQVVAENAVEVLKLTPSHLALVKDCDWAASRVRVLILGGEDLKTALAGAIARQNPKIRIFNEYGPTEATVGCMTYRFDPRVDTAGSVPIGQPGALSKIYLLDGRLNIVPKGAVGEIFVGGPGLARGYLNRPELTAERFATLPAGHGFGAERRLYRTGDLGSWGPDGQLHYLGRRDRQVKVRGTRLELGEIEAALTTHPQVAEAAVEVVKPRSAQLDPDLRYCTRCGLASNYPGVTFNDTGVCNTCQTYETYQSSVEKYFKVPAELRASFARAQERRTGDYDCLMLLSGGKDSTYALYQLVEMGLKVLALTLDNGYISEEAKANIRRVTAHVGVDHLFATTPAMNEIFVDSLKRHCNVCNGCFKTIYTLSMKLAYERGIPCIVTGLSRGQFFETRLSEELFVQLFTTEDDASIEEIDATILSARKAYHRTPDAISELLDVEVFKDDDIFEAIEIIDFYRYCDVELEEMLAFLRDRAPWIRPSDTGRSTNCTINNVGIYVHTQKQGFHNYALPYSWDVRMGHKTREEALAELNDEIDVEAVEKILAEIGYSDWREDSEAKLVAYCLPQETSGDFSTWLEREAGATAAELRGFLAKKLPRNAIPTHYVFLESMPLTPNGKLDRSALPTLQAIRPELATDFVPPQTPQQQTFAALWQGVLRLDRVGIHDDFFALGGDSIAAIQLSAKASDRGLALTPQQVFQAPTIAQLAAIVTTPAIVEKAPESAAETPAFALAQLNAEKLGKLAALLQKKDGEGGAPCN